MNIVQINYGIKGSTGTIMLNIAEMVRNKGDQCVTFSYPKKTITTPQNHIFFGSPIEHLFHRLINAITGFSEIASIIGTKKLLKELDEIRPDIIHLHNLHGWYVNLPMLFRYIKKNNIPVVWTLHDCWAFTGHCPHFTLSQCNKWKTGCHHCPSYREYPQSYVDGSKKMWRLKKKWFSGVQNMTIVTPSQWLANLVKQSFLKEYPVKVIYNGIDLSIFKPTMSDFRVRHGISDDKKILLGVAFGWGKRKGLDVFIELSKRLDENKYKIVLVGTDDEVDKQLPANIISIHRTQNQKELAEIYTTADLFVNPTREEVLGLVNIEANACGTPVLTFMTGGSPECIDETSGTVIMCDNIDAVEKEIIRIIEDEPYSEDACVVRAKNFDMNHRFKEYVDLYESKSN